MSLSQIGIGGPHDLGGVSLDSDTGKIDMKVKVNSYWETSIHALLVVLSTKKPQALASTDELRRCVEALEPAVYNSWGYYDRWSVALANILLERGVITQAELDEEINGDASTEQNGEPIFKAGDVVRVRTEDTRLVWRRPHIRCPGYIYGQVGVVEEYCGAFKDPFLIAFRCSGPKQHLYRVSFDLAALWGNTGAAAAAVEGAPAVGTGDRTTAEVYQGWLELVSANRITCTTSGSSGGEELRQHLDHEHEHEHEHDHDHHHQDNEPAAAVLQAAPTSNEHDHHDHDHGHDHSHSGTSAHESRYQVECVAADREGLDSTRPGKVVGEELLRLLNRKDVVTKAEVHRAVQALETIDTKMAGADLVAHAWKDAGFKARLLANGKERTVLVTIVLETYDFYSKFLIFDMVPFKIFFFCFIAAKSAAAEIGMHSANSASTTVLKVVANTPTTHHVVVCTLCSCYPIGLLGFSPAWYKSRAYRSRVVREPRRVLAEFGLQLPSEGVSVTVLDSTADLRYLVLPLPPAHLTAEAIRGMTVEELRQYVTRDSMIGVAVL